MTKPTMNEAIKNLVKARDERNHQPVGLDRNMAVLVPIELINAAEDAWARKPDDASTSMQALKDCMNEIVESIEFVRQTAKDTAANIKEDKNRRYEEQILELLKSILPFVNFIDRLDGGVKKFEDDDDLINPDICMVITAGQVRKLTKAYRTLVEKFQKEEKEQCPTAQQLKNKTPVFWEEVSPVLRRAEYYLQDMNRIYIDDKGFRECMNAINTLLIKGEEYVRKQRADSSTRTEDQRLQEYQPKDPKQ